MNLFFAASINILLILFSSSSRPLFGGNGDEQFRKFTANFIDTYAKLKIPELQLSYVDNFNNIQDPKGIRRQDRFFRKAKRHLKQISIRDLSPEFKIHYEYILYEIKQNIERLRLEMAFRSSGEAIPNDGIAHFTNGKAWHAYYIKKWTSSSVTPEQLFDFGLEEVARVQGKIKDIQDQLGFGGRDEEFYKFLNGPEFLFTREEDVKASLASVQEKIFAHLANNFEFLNIPVVNIHAIPEPTKDSPPGYYEDGNFYFNFYGNTFRKRTLEWLFMHEGIPGHHYQLNYVSKGHSIPFAKLFWYPGFSEGWAAYTENFGLELGLYADIYQRLGKWEWDLVRSARIVMDIGLNFKGWSKQDALYFWFNNIRNQDDIAAREIDRMLRWPAQVHSYKVGERKFLELRAQCMQELKSLCDIRQFHSMVLERGSVPLDVLSSIAKQGFGELKIIQ